jgi:hypothetical protein
MEQERAAVRGSNYTGLRYGCAPALCTCGHGRFTTIAIPAPAHAPPQTRPCYVYHFAVAASVEARMIRMRDALARGEAATTKAKAAALDKSARAGLRQGRELADANSASADRLGAAELVALLDPDADSLA